MTCFCYITWTTIIYSVHGHDFESPWLWDVNRGKSLISLAIVPGGGGTLTMTYTPERGTFSWLQLYKTVGIPQVEIYKGREIGHLGI